MTSISPIFSINGSYPGTTYTTQSDGELITLEVADRIGVRQCSFEILSVGIEEQTIPTLTVDGSVLPNGCKQTFTCESGLGDFYGGSYLIRCTINGGINQAGQVDPSLSTTSIVYIASISGFLPPPLGETFERNSTVGYTSAFNKGIVDAQTAGGGGTLNGDVTGVSTANTVVKLRNRLIGNIVPTDGYALTWNATGSGAWEPHSTTLKDVLTRGNRSGGQDLIIESGDALTLVDDPSVDTDAVNKGYLNDRIAAIDLTFTLAEILANGSSTSGHNLTVSSGDKLTVTDTPTNPLHAANKSYVDDGYSAALNTVASLYINKTGSVPFTGSQSMGGFKLTNVGTPTNVGDAATLGWVDGYVSSATILGDVTGALNSSTVTKLYNRTLDNAAPSTGDALTWDGTKWTFGVNVRITGSNNLLLGTAPFSTAGDIRGSKNRTYISARNNGDTNDLYLLTTDSSDVLTIGKMPDGITPTLAGLDINTKTTGSVNIKQGLTTHFTFDGYKGAFHDGYLQFGPTPAQTGRIRLQNNDRIYSRNGTDSGDLSLIYASGNNIIVGATGATHLWIGTSTDVVTQIGGVDKLTVTATSVDLASLPITGVANPTSSSHAANKSYADGYFGGRTLASTTPTDGYLVIWDAPSATWVIGNRSVNIGDGYVRFGANPSTAGTIRLAHGQSIQARNNANGANVNLLDWGSSTDRVVIGGTGVANMVLGIATSGTYDVRVNNVSEYNFSATVADFKDNSLQFGTNPATTGLVRVPNNTTALASKNAANTQNISMVFVDSADGVFLGDSTNGANIGLLVKTGGAHYLRVNSADEYIFSGTAADFKDNVLQFGTNPAATGLIRQPNNAVGLTARNGDNTQDIQLVGGVDGSNNVYLGGTANANDLYIQAPSAKTIRLNFATDEYTFDTAKLDLKSNYVVISQATAPGTPASGTIYLYVDSADGKLKSKNSSGTTQNLSA